MALLSLPDGVYSVGMYSLSRVSLQATEDEGKGEGENREMMKPKIP
jgi:hypothetical protein